MTKLYNKFLPYLLIATIVVISTLALWLPFLLKQTSWLGLKINDPGMNYVYRHFDGPLYIVPARTWYNPQAIESLRIETALPPSYFSAHLPLYPAVIAIFAPIMGFLKSMIFSNILFSVFLALFFYFLIEKFKLSKHPLLLTSIFLFLPRFLVVRSIGAPESLFIFLILTSIYFFEKKNYLFAGCLGGLAVMTKTPGLLLLPAYLLVFIEQYIKTKKIDWRGLWILFIPLGLVGVFTLYALQYGDFWAYFKSGDNIHLTHPFSAFNSQKMWVGDHWLEEIFFYFVLYGATVAVLWKSKFRSFFYFTLTFLIAVILVEHKDIGRYSLPLWPFALIAFEQFFTSKQFRWVFYLIFIPAALFLGWNFMLGNVMPISDWKAFL